MKKILFALFALAITAVMPSPLWAADGFAIDPNFADYVRTTNLGGMDLNWCGTNKILDASEECDTSVEMPGITDKLQIAQAQCALKRPDIFGVRECVDCKCVGCGDKKWDSTKEKCDVSAPPPATGYWCNAGETCNGCTCTICGNNIKEGDEECDFKYTHGQDPDYTAGLPALKDGCHNIHPEITEVYACSTACECRGCGDGYWDSAIGSPESLANGGCDESEIDPLKYTKMCYGKPELCHGCTCTTCGNNKKDADENCDVVNGSPDIAKCPEISGQRAIGCENDCTCNYTTLCGNDAIDVDVGERCDYNVKVPATGLPDLSQCPLVDNNPAKGCDNACKCTYPRCGDFTWDFPAEACDSSDPDPATKEKWCDGHPEQCVGCACRPSTPFCGDDIVNGTDTCEEKAEVATWKCDVPANGASIADYYTCSKQCACIPKETSALCHDGNFVYQPNPALPNFEQCDSKGTFADGTFTTPAEEQASSDSRCGAGEYCSFSCYCYKPNPYIPETPPASPGEPPAPATKTCVIHTTGASTPAAKEMIDKLNARWHEIAGTEDIDVFYEVGYGIAIVTIAFPDSALPISTALVGDVKRIVTDTANVAPWALIQMGGTPPYDYTKADFKPTLLALAQPTALLPPGMGAAGAAKAQSVGLKEVVFPDLSAVAPLNGITLTDVVTVLGADQVSFDTASPMAMQINNAVRWEVTPTVPTPAVKALTGSDSGVSIHQGTLRAPFDLMGFTAVEGFKLPEGMTLEDSFYENRKLDVDNVLEELKKRAAEWKAAGKPIDCEIAIGLPWDPLINQQYLAVQNSFMKAAVNQQGFAALPVMAEWSTGGGGCKCNMTASAPEASNLMLIIGMAASSLAGIVAVRRRKR